MILNTSLVLQGQVAYLIIIAHRYYPRGIVRTNPPSKPNIAPPTWQDWVREGMYDYGNRTKVEKSTSSHTPDIDDPSGAFRRRDGSEYCDPLVQVFQATWGPRSGRSPIIGLAAIPSAGRSKVEGGLRGRMASAKANVSAQGRSSIGGSDWTGS